MEGVPAWRKPIALVGWAVLCAFLIGVIVWGINQLAQDQATPTVVTTTTTTPPATTTTPTTTSTAPTTTTDTDTGTPTKSSSRGLFPHRPSVITLPSLPVITLPPGR